MSLVPIKAATIICSPAGGGAGTFSSPATLPDNTGFNRTDTYVVIEGSYGNRSINATVSGSDYVNIRAVDPALDSGIAGYNTSFFDSPATFNLVAIVKPRVRINGVRRDETHLFEEPTGYGIEIESLRSSTIDTQDAAFSEISYVRHGGAWSTNPGEDVCDYGDAGIYFVFSQHDVTFNYCAFNNTGHNGALAMMHGSDHITWNHCDFYMGWGKAGVATPNSGNDFHIYNFCRFWRAAQFDDCPDVEGGGITTDVGTYSYSGTTEGNVLNGCLFYVDAEPAGRNAIIQYGETSPGPNAVNCKVINCTFVGYPNNCAVGEIVLFGGSGNEVRNNLFVIDNPANIVANTSANNVEYVGDPFVDMAGGDFRLAVAVAGANLGAGDYDTDFAGNARGEDGVWDVGAYEFESGELPPPTFTYKSTGTMTRTGSITIR